MFQVMRVIAALWKGNEDSSGAGRKKGYRVGNFPQRLAEGCGPKAGRQIQDITDIGMRWCPEGSVANEG
jgi:hypothetical protein